MDKNLLIDNLLAHPEPGRAHQSLERSYSHARASTAYERLNNSKGEQDRKVHNMCDKIDKQRMRVLCLCVCLRLCVRECPGPMYNAEKATRVEVPIFTYDHGGRSVAESWDQLSSRRPAVAPPSACAAPTQRPQSARRHPHHPPRLR